MSEIGKQSLGRGGRRWWVGLQGGEIGELRKHLKFQCLSVRGGWLWVLPSDPSLTSARASYLGKTLARLISKSQPLLCPGKMTKSYFLASTWRVGEEGKLPASSCSVKAYLPPLNLTEAQYTFQEHFARAGFLCSQKVLGCFPPRTKGIYGRKIYQTHFRIWVL